MASTLLRRLSFKTIFNCTSAGRYPGCPPDSCPCGKPYSVDHAQICKLGGFIHRRHDDTVDLLAHRMKQGGYNDVEVEPPLQKLTGERFKHKTANNKEEARSDLRVRDFWTDAKNAHSLT